MPKVLHCIGEMGYGGAELLVSKLSISLSKQGCPSEIATMGYTDSELVKYIEAQGVKVHQVSTKPFTFDGIRNLAKLVRQGGFTHVHTHLFPCLYIGWILKQLSPKTIFWLYTEHSTSNKRRNRPWLASVERLIYGQYDRIVCITEDVQSSLLKWIPSLQKSCIIENGIDVDHYQNATPAVRKSYSLEPTDLIILMAGAFRTEKNQSTLIRSFQYLPDNFKLILAGTGPELGAAKELCSGLGLSDRVHFPGAVHNVEKLMKMADAYVLPSLFEGFGISAIEAAACGLPVVYSDVPGLGKLFSGVGIPIKPDDTQSIAAGIIEATKVHKDKSIYQKMSIALAKNYDLARTADKYKSLYCSSFPE